MMGHHFEIHVIDIRYSSPIRGGFLSPPALRVENQSVCQNNVPHPPKRQPKAKQNILMATAITDKAANGHPDVTPVQAGHEVKL